MSSGEDGTIRLFDVRSKTKCLCDGCKEDVLIDCQKAVTSFSVNPVQPYYVAIGCENSLLRVYDRRSLSTGEPGKEHDKQRGLLYQFKPKALEKRDCRVTSLKYSSDGENLLASYCSDYVYLLDSNPKQADQLQRGMEDETDGPCPNTGNDPPMKRLRLRGDWSDTGPNARPEGEEPGASEDNFVQRMSGYFTRWIEESIRNARRQRRRNPTGSRRRPEGDTEDHEDDPEQSDDGENSETLESALPLTEESCDEQRTQTDSDSDVTETNNDVTETNNDVTGNKDGVTETSNDGTGNKDDVTENMDDVTGSDNDVTNSPIDVANHQNNVTQKGEKVPNRSHNVNDASECKKPRDVNFSRDSSCRSRDEGDVTNSNSNDTRTYYENQARSKNLYRNRRRKRNNASDAIKSEDNTVRNRNKNTESRDPMTSCDDGIHDNMTCNHSNEMRDGELDRDPCGGAKLQSDTSSIRETKPPENEPSPAITSRGLSPTRNLCSEAQNADVGIPACGDNTGIFSTETVDSETVTTGSDTMDSSCCSLLDSTTQASQNSSFENLQSETLGSNCEGLLPDGDNNNLANERTQIGTRRNEPSDIESSENSSAPGISTRVTIPLGTNTRGSETPTMETGPAETASGNHEETVGESSRSVGDDSRRDAAASTIQNFFRFRVKKDFQSIPCDFPVHSNVKQVFKGHRNARTMIKEANFWGDDYVLSGSDCGRIFIWSRKTAEVVMLLEGDQHVVNCVQPHPCAPSKY
ncbi:DDB1- and CUL4-associated factor 6-like [Paramuricea clavata]|nr:DDB1- and CUL4-associated factor 6-like [Paramuricea clavata]